MKSWFLNLPLSRKQIYMFLAVGLAPMLVVSFIAMNIAREQLSNLSFQQLEAVRQIKASAIDRYFVRVESQIITQAQSPTIINAMEVFNAAFHEVPATEGATSTRVEQMREELRGYYTDEYGKKYQSEVGHSADISALLDGLPATAITLQYQYIQANDNALGEKHLLDQADGQSPYHDSHRIYHPGIRTFLEKFGYYDIFLVDIDSGDIVYSVFKELDYATSLRTGPYAETNFADAFREAAEMELGEFSLKDYQPYTPSYEAPASFMATPIFSEGRRTGVLIFQMPLDPINAIMTERSGMGESGESYLVGPDMLMRSDSFLDPINHSVSGSFKNPDLGKVDTEAARDAIAGNSDSRIITDYNGNPVLSSYSSIDLGPFSWAILIEIDEAEAFAGIVAMRWLIILCVVIGAAAISACALFVSKLISKPVIELSQIIQQVEREGNFQLLLHNKNQDEIGATSRAFGQLLTNLSSVITGTNMVLEELSKGTYETTVSEQFPGQLKTLTSGVNLAAKQVQDAQAESSEQAKQAKANADQAREAASKAEALTNETLIIKQALDVSATAVMIADTNNDVIYTNDAAASLMQRVEPDLQKALPDFSAANVAHSNLSAFSSRQDSTGFDITKGLSQGYQTTFEISGLTFKLTATPIKNDAGLFLGAVVEWQDKTSSLAQAAREKRLADENAQIRQALDNSSTGTMITDIHHKVIYANTQFKSLVTNAEADLNQAFGGFNAEDLIGCDVTHLHHTPTQLSAALNQLNSTHKEEFEAGASTFASTSNPIINDEGSRLGTVIEWKNRSLEVSIEKEIDGVIDAASKGDFSQQLNLEGKTGFFLTVSNNLNSLLQTTNIALEDIARIFSALANGDLSQTIERDYEGEFSKLKEDANGTIYKLKDILSNITNTSGSIARGASEISAGNASLGSRTEQQASSLEETSSSMEEITTMVQQSEDNAQQANNLALRSVEIARKGDSSVKQTAEAMGEISEASTKIANIIGVIDEIAFQTNLLALNAAVEAARAGEQGRGFAVVASEVRNLAQRSASAAKEIKDLIEDSVSKVDGGLKRVDESGNNLKDIVEGIEQVNSKMEDILVSAREQSAGIQQVNTAIVEMDRMTQENAALVEEATAASESMADQAGNLDQLVSFFRH